MPSRTGLPPKPRLVDQHMRVVLPKEVVTALGVKAGDHVIFQVDGNEVRLKRVAWSAK